MHVRRRPCIEPAKKPPYAAFQLSSVSRIFAEKFLMNAYVPPVAANVMVVPPKRVKNPMKLGFRRVMVFWIPVRFDRQHMPSPTVYICIAHDHRTGEDGAEDARGRGIGKGLGESVPGLEFADTALETAGTAGGHDCSIYLPC